MDIITQARKKIYESFNKTNLLNKYPVRDTVVNYSQLEKELERLIEITRNDLSIDGTRPSVFIFGPTGCGKCLAKGTKILMYNGELKNVEDIKIGDALMGPDSKPRTVESVCSGTEEMFDVIPVKGDKYTVNKSHILSLKETSTDKVVNISINDYLKKPKWFKHLHKGYRTGVEFEEKNVLIDPYYLGLWLGDGRQDWCSITNIDSEIINYMKNYAQSIGGVLYEDKNERISAYRIKFDNVANNPLIDSMREYNLIDNKHIPMDYKTNNRKNRLELLAGLLDSDGYFKRNCFYITQKRKVLAEDILYLARSLGFAAYMSEVKKSAHEGHLGTYFSITISGNCDLIPTKLPRKKASTRKQKKDVLKTGITVKSVGVGEYYGFSLIDEDKRFILGDFTITHNTEIVKNVAERNGAIFHKLEPQKVPIEELQGFPYIHQKEDGSKVVKLASPTILPPSDDERLWVLFLDEFNKADTESMAAIMNLVLNGEIGGFADFNEKTGKSEKYRLPKHCVIVGAGNMREQEGSTETNQVNTFDIATAERWHRVLYIEYDFESWLDSFALKPYTVKFNEKFFEFPSRIPPIILNYLMEVYIEGMDKKAPFLIPKPLENQNDVSSTFSPRAWTLLANSMISDFICYYKNPVEAFTDANIQIETLINNINELGLNGKEMVEKIIASFRFSFENNIAPEIIYDDYQSVRDKVKNVSKLFGMKTYLVVELAELIKRMGSKPDSKFTLDNSTLPKLANVSSFFNDIEATAEDMSAFIMTIKSSNAFSSDFSTSLSKVNKKYAEAYSYILHTDFSNI